MMKIRTINQTMKLIKEQDPDTAITERALRNAIRTNAIPHRNTGTKVLLNYDDVCSYFLMNRKEATNGNSF